MVVWSVDGLHCDSQKNSLTEPLKWVSDSCSMFRFFQPCSMGFVLSCRFQFAISLIFVWIASHRFASMSVTVRKYESCCAASVVPYWHTHSAQRISKMNSAYCTHYTRNAALLHLCTIEPCDAVNSVTDTFKVQYDDDDGATENWQFICGQRCDTRLTWFHCGAAFHCQSLILSYTLFHLAGAFSPFLLYVQCQSKYKNNSNTKNKFQFKTKIVWHCSTKRQWAKEKLRREKEIKKWKAKCVQRNKQTQRFAKGNGASGAEKGKVGKRATCIMLRATYKYQAHEERWRASERERLNKNRNCNHELELKAFELACNAAKMKPNTKRILPSLSHRIWRDKKTKQNENKTKQNNQEHVWEELEDQLLFERFLLLLLLLLSTLVCAVVPLFLVYCNTKVIFSTDTLRTHSAAAWIGRLSSVRFGLVSVAGNRRHSFTLIMLRIKHR